MLKQKTDYKEWKEKYLRRNKVILELRRQGKTLSEIADIFEISPQRVMQICHTEESKAEEVTAQE